MGLSEIYGAAALLSALVCGCFLGNYFLSVRRDSAYRKSVSRNDGGSDSILGKFDSRDKSLSGHLINYMRRVETRRSTTANSRKVATSEDLENMIRLAGLQGQVGLSAYRETKKHAFVAGGLIGALTGMVFSLELAIVLGLCGAFFGAQLPKDAIKRRIAKRTQESERHLPEMLEVMALCMRSGLSIDMSISIYARHFDTMLACEMEQARQKWSSGLERRDEALRKVASTYDSAILNRVIDTIVRSVRFGSSMVSSLESDAEEARSAFRSSKEERIAKAPVKMMIPTGVLILPAMLILVLGPVLLEFMGGGV